MDLFATGVIIFILVMGDFPIQKYAHPGDKKYGFLCKREFSNF